MKKLLLGKKVSFLHPTRGFWRLGTVYKEDKHYVSVRDTLGHRCRVPNSPDHVLIFEQEKKP